MATVRYRVKDTQIRVNVSAKDTSASICWIGITETEEACWSGSDESCYCESVYIGENTDCNNNKHYSGTFEWHGITIHYYITQAHAEDCHGCGTKITYCDIIDYYTDPYYVDYDTTSVTVYYNYWYTQEDDCNITRERMNGSTSVDIDPSSITCDNPNRELDVPFRDGCGASHVAKCYVQKPSICCDEPNKVCYAINNIVYSPSIVPSSGANVSYYFDYKKREIVDCVEKITFGRYEGTWKIEVCDNPQRTAPQRCCRDHIERRALSAITHDWDGDDKVLCSGGLVKGTELSIIQTKNPSYTGDCSNVCEQDTGYCVTLTSITTSYKNANDEWIPWGQWASNSSNWRWLDSNYKLPYFGGDIKVTWEYSAYTVYDDCTTGATSGNKWEDILDILPYSGDCYDNTKNQCGIISITSEDANKCNGGVTKFSFTTNEVIENDYVTHPVSYTFKKAPCDVVDKAKFPSNIAALCDCNKFTIKYKQKKTICNDDCGRCVNNTSGHSLATGATTITDTFNTSCDIRVVDKPYWIPSVTINRNTITYKIEENKGSDREGGVTFQLNGKDCYDTVIISQKGSGEDVDPHDEDPEIGCDCNTATFEAYGAEMLPTEGGTHLIIGSYIYDECVTLVATKSGSVVPAWLSNISYEGGYIYANVSINTSLNERTATLYVTYSTQAGECTPTQISVKQNKGDCTMTLEASTDVCWKDGGSVTFIPKY